MPLNDRCLLALSGTGPLKAGQAAALLIANGADALVSWGCAAALSPDLVAGDLLLPAQLVGIDGRRYAVDASWRQRLQSQLGEKRPIHCDSLLESDRILTNAGDKKALASTADAIALDMESVAIARIAGERRVPFVALRAVADTADMDVPGAVIYALEAQGCINRRKLLHHTVRHPVGIIGLMRLARAFQSAMRTLRELTPLAEVAFLLDAKPSSSGIA